MKNIVNIVWLLGVFGMSRAQTVQPALTNSGNQLFESARVSFGIKAGLSYSCLYGKEIGSVFAGNKTEYEPGYHLGLLVNTKTGKNFWLKHELLFNHRTTGVLLSDSINGDYGSMLTMSYLELQPANATFHIKGFQIYAGPYISALIDARIRDKDENGNYVNDHSIYGTPGNDESKRKYLQKFDFGINAGLEYQLPMGLSVGIKYAHGVTDIFQYANSYTHGDAKNGKIKIYNRAFMISVGYVFR